MKAVAAKIDGRDFLGADFLPYRIGCGVELCPNFQTRRRRGCRNKVNNNLVADEGFTPPVLADEGEQTVLDLVPLTSEAFGLKPTREYLEVATAGPQW